MDRIRGLTDDDKWKTEPLFEKKFYYRAENIVTGRGIGNESDLEDDVLEGGNDDSNVPMYNENTSLDEYKTEKIDQVRQYHLENSIYNPDPENAAELLRSCQHKIRRAINFEDVDDLVKMFHDELVKNELNCSYGLYVDDNANVGYV